MMNTFGRAVLAGAAALAVVVTAAPPAAAADRVRDAQWHLRSLNISQAHKVSKGAGVTVAVIDTGVDAKHPDLAGAVLPGADFAIIKAKNPDGRTDLDGHGTAMAGLIAARGRGGNGALGIAPEAKILPVRDAEDGIGMSAGTAEPIEWAVAHGARVINMSFGSGSDSEATRAAVEAAQRADVVLVASAGNRPADRVEFPAAYPGVVAVAGVDRNGKHAAVSVTGSEVLLAAPATNIRSTDRGADGRHGYRSGSGTSGASAIVAGVAALVRAKYPNLSAAEVIHRLTATATDKGKKGRDPVYGYGYVNPVAALTAHVPPLADNSAEPADPVPPIPPGAGASAPTLKSPLPLGGVLALGFGVLLLIGAVGFAAWRFLRRGARTAQ